MDKKRYDILKPNDVYVDNSIPNSIIPKPTQGDYNAGYIDRYFLQERDCSGCPIFEVDFKEFSKYNSSAYYKSLKLKWRIIGKLVDTYYNGAILPSVTATNKKIIAEAASVMPDIRLYLVNPTQFYKPT